ncbi:3D domain-containing protein [Lysinibacillus endophyticus]
MKIKLTLSMLVVLFIAITFTANAKAMEMERTITLSGEGVYKKVINEIADTFFYDKALYTEMIQYKTVQIDTYEVKKGDNLYSIAQRHNIKLEDLMSWNKKTDSLIHPGEQLVLEDNGNLVEVEDVISEPSVVQEQPSVKEEQPYVSDNQTVQVSEEKAVDTPKVEEEIVQEVKSEPVDLDASAEMTVTATAYTAYCEGCSGKTAIGIDLRANPNQKVIAVDPNVIPLGSKVWVEGYGEAVAGDTGGAIKGNKIDVFIPSYDQAMAWGRKTVKVKILN